VAFGIRKFAVRVQVRNGGRSATRRLTLAHQRRIGSGVKAPKSAKNSQARLKGLLRGNKLKKRVG
jgi:hypothetical protein